MLYKYKVQRFIYDRLKWQAEKFINLLIFKSWSIRFSFKTMKYREYIENLILNNEAQFHTLLSRK